MFLYNCWTPILVIMDDSSISTFHFYVIDSRAICDIFYNPSRHHLQFRPLQKQLRFYLTLYLNASDILKGFVFSYAKKQNSKFKTFFRGFINKAV